MKNPLSHVKKIFVTLTLISLSSCASTDQITMLEKRVNGLAIENAQMREELKQLKPQTLRSEIELIQKNQARLDNRLNEINAELMRISGALDQLNYNYTRDRSRLDKLEMSLSQTQAPVNIDTHQEPTTSIDIDMPKTLDKPKEIAAIPQKGIEKAPPTDLYKLGIESFKQKKFAEAKRYFEDYIKENPNGKFVSNAHFWIGECYYNMQKFEEAILEYQIVIDKYPNSEKVSGALLKQGISFHRIGDNKSAKTVLNKLIRQYPNSPQASIAQDYLKKIN